MAPILTLGTFSAGHRCRITGYISNDPAYRHQLLALGMTPGAEVQVIRLAPLGDPMQIRVRGSALFLRKADADVVRVEML